ncbi:hypothetical protein ACQKWADRAFT_307961 [Trichoderma austrokoningii]
MPVTRATANKKASTTRKAKSTSEGVSKPPRQRKAKVTKSTGPVKADKGKGNKDISLHLSIGSKIPASDTFGGELYLHDGTKTSLKQLVDTSRYGVICYLYPKPWDDDAYDVYGEFEHAQLDWEPAEMDTLSIASDSASSTTAFIKEKDIRLPLLSNPSGSLFKALSITSSKGNTKQGAFVISKTGVLLARTIGNPEKVIDSLHRVISILIEEKDKESDK